jgi:hypothetical protein
MDVKKQKTIEHCNDNYSFTDEVYLKILSNVEYDMVTYRSLSLSCKLFNSLLKDKYVLKAGIYNEILKCKIPLADLLPLLPFIEKHKDTVQAAWVIRNDLSTELYKYIQTLHNSSHIMEIENGLDETYIQYKDDARYSYGRFTTSKIYGKRFFKNLNLENCFKTILKFLEHKSDIKVMLFTADSIVICRNFRDGTSLDMNFKVETTQQSILASRLPKTPFEYTPQIEATMTNKQYTKTLALISNKNESGPYVSFCFANTLMIRSVELVSQNYWTFNTNCRVTNNDKTLNLSEKPVKQMVLNKSLKTVLSCFKTFETNDISCLYLEALEMRGVYIKGALKSGTVVFFAHSCLESIDLYV